MDFEQTLSRLVSIDQQCTLAVNGSDSLFIDNIMRTVTDTFAWSLVIVVLLVVIIKNNTWRGTLITLLVMAAMIAVADRICSGLVKPWVARWRPTQDPMLMYCVDVVNEYRGGRFGFFSGHACNTMCMAVFLSLLFRSPRLTATLLFWSISTTYTRLYLGVHYLGDVCVGFIVGAILGWLFHLIAVQLYGHEGRRRHTSARFTPSGYLLSDVDTLLAVIFFNYICVVIFAMTLGVD